MQTHVTTPCKPGGGRIHRGDKARFLVNNGHVHPRGDDWNWTVESESGAGQYRVSRYTVEGRERWDCNCPDYVKHAETGDRDHACKHAMAVWFWRVSQPAVVA